MNKSCTIIVNETGYSVKMVTFDEGNKPDIRYYSYILGQEADMFECIKDRVIKGSF